jgi:hypothetical protein
VPKQTNKQTNKKRKKRKTPHKRCGGYRPHYSNTIFFQAQVLYLPKDLNFIPQGKLLPPFPMFLSGGEGDGAWRSG